MINLSDSLAEYLEITYSYIVKNTLYRGFRLLEEFGVSYYEEKYVALLTRENLDSIDKSDGVKSLLHKDMLSIIEQHELPLQLEYDITLIESVELAEFLYRIQRLEDYSILETIVNSPNTPKEVFVRIITTYSEFKEYRVREILGEVKECTLDAFKAFIEDHIERDIEESDTERIDFCKEWIRYLGEQHTIASEAYLSGYSDLTLEELINLFGVDMESLIDNKIVSKPSIAALEALSLLILTKDNYRDPVGKFSDNSNLFTSNLNNVTKLKPLIISMYSDFTDQIGTEDVN